MRGGVVLVTTNPEHRRAPFRSSRHLRPAHRLDFGLSAPQSLAEDFGERYGDVGVACAKNSVLDGMHARGGMDEHLARPWIDHPDVANAELQVVGDLTFDSASAILWRQDLDT